MDNEQINALLVSLPSAENKTAACIEIAKAYMQISDYDNALKYLNSVSDDSACGNLTDLYFETGRVYLFKNNYEEALKYFTKVLNSTNDTDYKNIIYMETAKIYMQTADYDKALNYFKIILNTDKFYDFSELYFETGKAYFFKNEYKKSIKYMTEAKKNIDVTSDKFINIMLLLSKSYKKIGDYQSAEKVVFDVVNNCNLSDELKQNFDIHEKFFDRYPGKYEYGGNYKKLIKIYKKILAANPYNKEIICFLAQTYNYLGKYDKTAELYDKYRENVKGNIFFENKLLNEYEIASKKTVLKSKPRNLMAVLSNKCNLSCIMCRAIENTWELPQERLDEIKSLFPYLERVLWQGGEVLLLKSFKDLLKESLNYKNIKQAILTNFQLADEEIINMIVKNDMELRISIDGVTKELYEKIRRKGSFEKLIQNINRLNDIRKNTDTKMTLNMNVVVMRENYKKLTDFIEFAHKYHFETVTFNKIEYNLTKDSDEEEINLSKEQDIFENGTLTETKDLTKQLNLVYKIAKKYNIQTEIRFDMSEFNARALSKEYAAVITQKQLDKQKKFEDEIKKEKERTKNIEFKITKEKQLTVERAKEIESKVIKEKELATEHAKEREFKIAKEMEQTIENEKEIKSKINIQMENIIERKKEKRVNNIFLKLFSEMVFLSVKIKRYINLFYVFIMRIIKYTNKFISKFISDILKLVTYIRIYISKYIFELIKIAKILNIFIYRIIAVVLQTKESVVRYIKYTILNIIAVLRNVLFEIIKYFYKYKDKFINWLKKKRYKRDKNKFLCHLPWNTMTFYYDGSVRPDCLCDMNKIIGHLKDSSIRDLWNADMMQKYREHVAYNKCDNWCNDNCIYGRVLESYLKLL